MHSNFRGEAIYSAEQDIHFPQLTVGDTLGFAAEARAPREPPGGMKKHEYAQILRDVVMASLGITHTINTKARQPWPSVLLELTLSIGRKRIRSRCIRR